MKVKVKLSEVQAKTLYVAIMQEEGMKTVNLAPNNDVNSKRKAEGRKEQIGL